MNTLHPACVSGNTSWESIIRHCQYSKCYAIILIPISGVFHYFISFNLSCPDSLFVLHFRLNISLDSTNFSMFRCIGGWKLELLNMK